MTAHYYSLLAASIFALVAALQFIRAIGGVPVTIGRTAIPMWASWVACGIAVIISWLGFVAFVG
jgi:hypothetical protein